MSQIIIEIPIEALTRANVAKALTELTLALGGHAAAPAAAPKAAAPAVVVSEYVAKAAADHLATPAPKAAPAPTPAPAAVEAPAKRKGGRPPKAKPAVAAAPAPAAVEAPAKRKGGRPPKAKPVVAAAPAPAAAASGSGGEKWRNYVANLPENSRRFLELLEKQGQLTVNEAVEKLNLPGPKAMGGLTGAMARWAPKQGIQIPYEAKEAADGTRYWVWKGIK
jgi:outer membrane biosynthesis protein TonB